MSNRYIRFYTADILQSEIRPIRSGLTSKSKITFKKMISYMIGKVIPMANPDFDSKIGNVHQWLMEFEVGKNGEYPNREIGLDIEGNIIMKMPWRNNYGYWTDNNLGSVSV